MQVVISAGGIGERLRPVTYQVPKPMVPICGKPFLHYQLLLLRTYNIDNILILIGYLGDQIERYFKDGSEYGMKIAYSSESTPLGTGGSLKLAEPLLDNEFFLIYGDSYLHIDYNDFEMIFRRHNKKGLVAIYDNFRSELNVPGNLSMSKDSVITKYSKNSKENNFQFVEAGVMAFKKEVVDLIPPNGVVSFEQEIFPLLIKERELAGHVTHQRFYDIGTTARIKDIERYLKSNTVGDQQ